ncbi:bifunctional Translation protein SH3-like domain superfamily/Ribosomal protein L2 [Babesia duncani]|uniref:Bifunctional Translation protein SH3-like domain superfamily/Ribosomal protein L2 n=1 Tax=Babesia duncani TaxID=323732 RepID=A0AAD9UND0_9APIC|nr:bifunctional Translation protein SH3-like domain superfamily/Ribosomal protein L2 [Babesia duncani]
MPLFKKFVEPGRLCEITYGPDTGKVCLIIFKFNITVVLYRRYHNCQKNACGWWKYHWVCCYIKPIIARVDRKEIPLTWLRLTPTRMHLERGAKTGTLAKAIEKNDPIAKFNKTTMGKRREKAIKLAGLNDFERFTLMVAKKQRKVLAKQVA